MILSISILYQAFGLVIAILAFFLFPLTLFFAPLYALFFQGDWLPLLVNYGGAMLGGSLVTFGQRD